MTLNLQALMPHQEPMKIVLAVSAYLGGDEYHYILWQDGSTGGRHHSYGYEWWIYTGLRSTGHG